MTVRIALAAVLAACGSSHAPFPSGPADAPPPAGTITLTGCGGTAGAIIIGQVEQTNPPQIVKAGSYFAPGIPVNGEGETASGTYAPLVPTSYDYTNIPATITNLRTLERLGTSRGVMYQDSTNVAVMSNHETPTLDMPGVPIATTGFEIVTDGTPIATEHGEQLVFDWGP